MAALTADRKSIRREGHQYDFPVAAGAVIFAGSLVVLDAGNAKPGAVATGLVAVGVAQSPVDNSAGAGGDVTVPVRAGVYAFVNNGGSVGHQHIGSPAYIVDDQTVSESDGTGTRSAAGTIRDVTSDGVFVAVGL